MNTDMKLQKVPVEKLKPAKYNPRKDLKPGDPAYEKIKRSMTTYGYVDPVIWNEVTGNIVGGHQRYKVLVAEGVKEIDCVVVHIENPQDEKALNIALNVGMTLKKTVAIFSLEMSREQLTSRLLSRAALIPSQNLLTGQLSEQQWRDIADAAQTLSASDIRIDDNPTLTVSEMNAQCRRVPDLGLVVIDYLQLMQSAGSGHSWSNESRTQAVSDISRMLKIMAKELNVPVVCLSQLSRANESRQDKRPMLSDLRESGAIEQDADVVIGLYRDGYYNKECENPNLAEAIVLKNRKGSTGTVELSWLPEYTSFGSVEKRRDDEY